MRTNIKICLWEGKPLAALQAGDWQAREQLRGKSLWWPWQQIGQERLELYESEHRLLAEANDCFSHFAFIRPHLGYCMQFWDLQHRKDIHWGKFSGGPPRRSRLEQFLCMQRLRDQGLFNLDKGQLRRDLIVVSSSYGDVIKETDPGSSQWHVAGGWDKTGINWKKWASR